MIKINQNRDIIVKDIKRANFSIDLSDQQGSGNLLLDLDAKDFMQGGSLSTGLFVADLSIYILDKYNILAKHFESTPISLEDLKVMRFSHLGDFHVNKMICLKGFESLPSVDPLEFCLTMFCDRGVNNQSIFYKADIIKILINSYMYQYSQVARDVITSRAVQLTLNESHGNSLIKYSDVINYNEFIDDYINIDDNRSSLCFSPMIVYPLSSANRSTASGKKEKLSYLNNFIIKDYYKSNFRDALSKHPEYILYSVSEYGRDIFNISTYKAIKDDCLIGCNLSAKYKIDDNICDILTGLFLHRKYDLTDIIAGLLSNKEACALRHKDIVFDKSPNEIISSDMIKLELQYSSFTRGGGRNLIEYDKLEKKNITPKARRDVLYELCSSISDNAGFDNAKLFSKLNVDFKRFYNLTI